MNLAVKPDFPLSTSNDSLAWYALKVRTRSEAIAAQALRLRGYVTLSPVYQERRRYSDRMKSIDCAAFPGYVFCRFGLGAKTPVLSSPAVEYIVSRAGVPVTIEDAEVQAIDRMIAAGGRAVPYLRTGQRVRVESGPLQGLEGIFVRSETASHVTLSMDLLQRSIAVRIDAESVCPL